MTTQAPPTGQSLQWWWMPIAVRRRLDRLAHAVRRSTIDPIDPYGVGASHPVHNATAALELALAKVTELADGNALDEGNGQALDSWLQSIVRQWHVLVDLEFSTLEREARAAEGQAVADLEWRIGNVDRLEAERAAVEAAIQQLHRSQRS